MANGNGTGNSGLRFDDPDTGYDRPPPKGTPELFNPKGPTRSGGSPASSQSNGSQGDKEPDRKARTTNTGVLLERMGSMSIGDTHPASVTSLPVADVEGDVPAAEEEEPVAAQEPSS